MRGWRDGQRHHHRTGLATNQADIGLLDILIAIVIGLVIWRTSIWFIRTISTPPPELDPGEVVTVDQDFRCSICGAQVTMRVANVAEMVPPKHCREEMELVDRGARS